MSSDAPAALRVAADKGVELEALASVDHDQQRAAVAKVKDGAATSIREAIEQQAPQPADQPKNWISLAEWTELPGDERKRQLALRGDRGFNRQNNASIEWAQWSWNPVTGCKHDCPYCYARDIANRFYRQKFEPSIIPERLTAPSNTKVPDQAQTNIAFKNVFSCSMADLFGRWVPAEWIEAVLEQVRAAQQWNFLFLTKFPKRLAEFEFPQNAWVGTTVDCQARVKAAEQAFERIDCAVKWLSVEPMIEPLKFSRLDLFDWLVLGGASKSTETPEWRVPTAWWWPLHQEAMAPDGQVFMKDNLFDRYRDFPGHADASRSKVAPAQFDYLRKKSSEDALLGEA